MAIIHTYPSLPLSKLNSVDTFPISGVNASGEIVTSTVSLSNLSTYITNTGTGTGTTNTLTLWSDGPNGVLGDSILTQNVGATALTVTGNFISTGTGNFTGQVTIPATPAAATDAASKNYVDTEVAGIPAGLVFKGNWNANTNSPALASGTGTVGNYYVVSVAGNTDLDGITDWQVGDWAVFVEVGGVDKWDKIDQTFVSGSGASGQVTFWNTINTVNGDNDFYWDNTNKRLGIGMASPSGRLEVDGDVKIGNTTTGAQLLKNGNDFDIVGVDVGGNAFNSLHLKADSLAGLYIEKDTNNIGIGTTSPSVALQLGNSTAGETKLAIFNSEGGGEVGLTIQSRTNRAKLRVADNDSNAYVVAEAGKAFFGTSANGDATNVTVLTSGNVGIGTTSPGTALQVGGLDDGSNYDITLGWNAVGGDAVGTKRSALTFKTGQNSVNQQDIYKWDIAMLAATATQSGENFGSDLAFLRSTRNSTDVDRVTMLLSRTGDIFISPRATAASSGSGILYFKNVDDNSATINGGSIRTVDSSNNPSGADMRFQIANDNGTLFDAVTIDSNGFMGIGVTAPDQQLEVNGNIKVGTSFSSQKNIYFGDSNFSIRTENNYTASNLDNLRFAVADNADAGFRFTNTNNDELLYIKSQNGKVGIGTTSPTSNLYVSGSNTDATDKPTMISESVFTVKPVALNSGNLNFAQVDQGSSIGMQYTNGDGTANWDISMQPFGGNIGIGTTSPQAVLEIKKENNGNISENIRLWNPGGSSGTGNKISFGAGSTYAEKASITGFFASGGTGQLAISVNGANALSIDSSQNATFAGDVLLEDNKILRLGSTTGGDFNLGFDGNNGFASNLKGDLYIQNFANNKDIIFRSDDGGGSVMTYFLLDGSLAAGSVPVTRFPDNSILGFGDSTDLKIYHDGSNSYIDDSGAGDLRVRSNFMTIEKYNNGEIMAVFNDDNAVSLYFDNSKKFETTSTGVSVTGDLVVTGNIDLGDNDYIRLGDSQDLQIYHNVVGGDSIIQELGAGDLQIYSNTELKIASGTLGETYAKFTKDGPIELYYDNNKKFETTSSGVKIPTAGDGITLVSPDGNTTRTISIDNSGNLVVNP